MIRIALIDDQIIIREGLKTILQEYDELSVAMEFSTAGDAIERYEELLSCQIIILDISMPQRSGLEFLKELYQRDFPIPILILSVYPNRVFEEKAKEFGAQGYLNKNCSVETLISEIYRIVGYKHTHTGETAGAIDQPQMNDTPGLLETLSIREREVFRLLCDGKTTKEIAFVLNISIKSVATYKTRLMEKLGVDSLQGLLRIGMTIDW